MLSSFAHKTCALAVVGAQAMAAAPARIFTRSLTSSSERLHQKEVLVLKTRSHYGYGRHALGLAVATMVAIGAAAMPATALTCVQPYVPAPNGVTCVMPTRVIELPIPKQPKWPPFCSPQVCDPLPEIWRWHKFNRSSNSFSDILMSSASGKSLFDRAREAHDRAEQRGDVRPRDKSHTGYLRKHKTGNQNQTKKIGNAHNPD